MDALAKWVVAGLACLLWGVLWVVGRDTHRMIAGMTFGEPAGGAPGGGGDSLLYGYSPDEDRVTRLERPSASGGEAAGRRPGMTSSSGQRPVLSPGEPLRQPPSPLWFGFLFGFGMWVALAVVALALRAGVWFGMWVF